MDLTILQKKKHLLLLNRIMRGELKGQIIPTPSKLTDDDINNYFSKLFTKKDDYYVPIKNKMEIKIDEEKFKGLIKKPKEKKMKEEVSLEDKAKTEEDKIKSSADIFIIKLINPYLRKQKSGEDAELEKKMMIDRFYKLSYAVKQNIKKRWSKLYTNILEPADEERTKRKMDLKEEDAKLKKDIRKKASAEKRKLKMMD